jgi:hypothetical protein
MNRYLVLFQAPASVIDEWQKKPEAERKPAEEKMMQQWREWMSAHGKMFTDKGAGVGKTKRVTAEGVADRRNDIMLYQIVEAESHDAAAKAFVGHPHFTIPQASIEISPINPLPG